MSFQSPLWLLALALVPLALIAYLGARRRARRYAIRFTAVPTLRAAAQTSPGLTQHLPAAGALAALALLAVALARPHIRSRVPVGQASVMLVSDHSGSMEADDVAPSRLAAAIKAANTFIGQLPSTVKVGAVAFSNSPDAAQPPLTDHRAARTIIDTQTADGGTDTGGALTLALQELHGSEPKHPPSAIVLLSDGAANLGPNPVTVAQTAKQEHIPIYTVALGTAHGVLSDYFGQTVPVPPDPELMRQIAETSGGRAFDANSADQLSSIYKSLGDQLGSVSKKREITFVFAIGGVILLLGAVGASVLLRRMP